jgi:hypothetical protein
MARLLCSTELPFSAEGEKRRRRMNIITLASSTEQARRIPTSFDDIHQGRKKNFMKMEGKIFVARRSLLFFVLQVRQCRNDKMSLRNGAAAAKKKREKREAHERRQRRGREKSSLILIDASLSTA